MRGYLITAAVGILGGTLAFFLWYGIGHLYQDHKLVDAIRVNIQQQQQPKTAQ